MELYDLFIDNSSIKFLNKIYEDNKFDVFVKDYIDEGCIIRKSSKSFYFDTTIFSKCPIRCVVTDYTCIKKYYEGGVIDESNRWIEYMLKNLQGEDKEKYLKGLLEFSERVSKVVKEEFLKPAVTELDKLNAKTETTKSKKRLIEQQIEQGQKDDKALEEKVDVVVKANMKHYNELEAKGKTTVINPEITREEIEQAVESARRHDTENGQLL